MTREQKNVIVAEFYGWRFPFHDESMKTTAIMMWVAPGNADWETQKLPDFCNDLNAMHKVLMTLNSTYLSEYGSQLNIVMNCGTKLMFMASAEQQVDALIKLLGKWVD
jgi:hypothetical protein